MSSNRKFIPAWLMNAAAWLLRRPGVADLLVLVAVIILLALGAGYE
ncbi:hypothetical protein [Marinobacter sp. ATCH36]|nr:hypothetical protein [Marinobacter sp. ATCH36]MCL7944064.1 hypothetical protein [Marinobacter sp. ATCH36]